MFGAIGGPVIATWEGLPGFLCQRDCAFVAVFRSGGG
jgi:hypothetical protein